MTSQLEQLAKPFPASAIHQIPKGGRQIDYVSHADVVAKLLATVGPYSTAIKHWGHDVWGVAITMTVDGNEITVEDVSTDPDAENAVSRAFCRAAMRAGVGQHLWARNDRLTRALTAKPQPQNPDDLTRQRQEMADDDKRIKYEDEMDERPDPDGPEPWGDE